MILVLILIVLVVVEALALLVVALKPRKMVYDGEIEVTESNEKKSYNLRCYGDPYDLDQKETALFRVVSVLSDGPRK